MKTSNVIYLSAFVSTLVLALAFAVITYYPRYQRYAAKAEDKARIANCLDRVKQYPLRFDNKLCSALESDYRRMYFEEPR